MKATFCKIDDTHYQANFRGRFWKVVPFRYSIVLTVVEDDGDVVHLQGSTYLGRIMGTFSYDATATANSFSATYSAARDYGTWVLSR